MAERVLTVQEAIEAAPTLVYPDGDGGATFHVLDDDAVLRAASTISERNGWSDEEAGGLYEAVLELLAIVAEEVVVSDG